ncbi:MAG: P-type DNA transfer ATPase VirB11 [Sphingomicrobium sp.]
MNLARAIAATASEPGVYLRSALAPLAGILARSDVTDIYVNRPGEIWIETIGGSTERREEEELDGTTLMRLARQVAALTDQGISREHPLLSAVLPDGSRIQIIAPPATFDGPALAIRKHVAAQLALEDYDAAGAFSATAAGPIAQRPPLPESVISLLRRGQMATALAEAVRERLNILVSGGTSSGKTTFLNALIGEIPAQERLITIEDTPELRIGHCNALGLIAVRGSLGEAQVSANDLVSASLRMRPDRIILGELRGVEALAFLRALNSGHPGSMTTIHADSPESALEQLTLLVLQGGTALGRADVRAFVTATIDLFVQLGRVAGNRTIERIAFREP